MLSLAFAAPFAAPSADARVVEPVTVTKSVTVPASEARTLNLRCPARAAALNGSVRGALAGAESIPSIDPRNWSFRFTAGAAPREVLVQNL